MASVLACGETAVLSHLSAGELWGIHRPVRRRSDAGGNVVNRCEGIAFAGGAAFSSEEGYLATKLMRGLGVVHMEQQARV